MTTDPVLASENAFEHEEIDDRSRMSFLEHLEEFRRRLIYSLYALLACCGVTLFFWRTLFAYYVGYFSTAESTLIFTKPMAGFMFSLKISVLVGLVAAAPFIFSQVWLFVAPGLYAREKRMAVPFVFFSSLLFFTGAYFAHRVAYPAIWAFFEGYADYGLQFMPTIDDAFSLYLRVALGLGLVFQMPILVFVLSRFGIVSARFLVTRIKYAVLIIVVVAAVISPSGDAVGLAVFAAPMFALYLVSIVVAWLFGKKTRVKDA